MNRWQPIRSGQTEIDLRLNMQQVNKFLVAFNETLDTIDAMTNADAGTIVTKFNALLAALKTE